MKILYHHRIASNDGQYLHLRAIKHQFEEIGCTVILSGPSVSKNDRMGGQKSWVRVAKQLLPGAIYESLEFFYNFPDFIKLLLLVYKNKPDFIYERANLYLVSGIWISKLLNIPLLLEVNAPLYAERDTYGTIYLKRLARWTEEYTWRNATCVLPVTGVLANTIRSSTKPRNLEIIPNGVNPKELEITVSKQDLSKSLGLENNIVIGFVGFVRDWHRLDRVIDYIQESGNPNLCLLIVGEGPAKEELLKHAKKANIENHVLFTGVVQRSEIANYINIFDIAIQPAVTAYASPLKLFEYMYLGKTIVAPDSENIREILVNEFNAYLFTDTGKSFKQTLHKALIGNQSDQTGNNAKSTIVEKKLLWKSNAEKIIEIGKNSNL